MIIYRYQTVSINRSATPTNEFSDFKTEQKNPKKTKKNRKNNFSPGDGPAGQCASTPFLGHFSQVAKPGIRTTELNLRALPPLPLRPFATCV